MGLKLETWLYNQKSKFTRPVESIVSTIVYTDFLSISRSLSFTLTHFWFSKLDLKFKSIFRQVDVWIVWIFMVFLRTYPIIGQVLTQIKAQFEALLVKYNFDSFKNLNNREGSFLGEFFSIRNWRFLLVKSKVQILFW